MSESHNIQPLVDFLKRMPSVHPSVVGGASEDRLWWVKFSLDISDPLAWSVVQELGHLLNYVSLDERLPTVFMPISPPPYLNGGPADFLSWVVESQKSEFTPTLCVEWLKGRLPNPVDDLTLWNSGND
ncbi:MAG TPA: hypothetical protein VGB45_11585 [Abditibacterium sp.]|jgi:hypothetical protein